MISVIWLRTTDTININPVILKVKFINDLQKAIEPFLWGFQMDLSLSKAESHQFEFAKQDKKYNAICICFSIPPFCRDPKKIKNCHRSQTWARLDSAWSLFLLSLFPLLFCWVPRKWNRPPRNRLVSGLYCTKLSFCV